MSKQAANLHWHSPTGAITTTVSKERYQKISYTRECAVCENDYTSTEFLPENHDPEATRDT